MFRTRKDALLLLLVACAGVGAALAVNALHKWRPEMLASLFNGSRGSISLACTPESEDARDEEIYFVSCGGTF